MLPEHEALYERLTALSKALESSGRLDTHEHPDAYRTILDAMNVVVSPMQHRQIIGYLTEHNFPKGNLYRWQFSETLGGVYPDTALRIIPVYGPSEQANEMQATLTINAPNGDKIVCHGTPVDMMTLERIVEAAAKSTLPEWFDRPFSAPSMSAGGIVPPTPREFGAQLVRPYLEKIKLLEEEIAALRASTTEKRSETTEPFRYSPTGDGGMELDSFGDWIRYSPVLLD